MDEPIVTFGLLMGLEVESKRDTGASDDGKEALLIFCATSESGAGNIDITPRMMDLALMGFAPVAIARWDPADIRYCKIFATEGLSQVIQNAVLKETGSLVREALEASELVKYSTTENND
ncbi:hypothetical protein SBA5_490059 [Candidatus Sulfotelmatomonas gaucii]|uniref:Uncharacterized protein n=1 Tax=Candidatus Sulfuritelmatomonas gaucii TaxID=2043161 RepID=A0A2N9LQ24_9BACT|nr:hypothetical protein SBA5_490059 [Candidatus Sulfotelmatomonas gaucii]